MSVKFSWPNPRTPPFEALSEWQRPTQIETPQIQASPSSVPSAAPSPLKQTFWIAGPLPGLNDLITSAKGFRGRGYGYAKLKRKWNDRVIQAVKSFGLQPMARVRFHFLWREKARRRDPDNIAGGGHKVVIDGLVNAGILANDGWNEVAGWVDEFEINTSPGVLVTIIEDGNERSRTPSLSNT